MTKYCIKTEDNNYYCTQGENVLQPIITLFEYTHGKNEIIQKALSRMDSMEEAIRLYNDICDDFDDRIETVFEIGEAIYGEIPFITN